jgi:hypothetical protein
MIGGGPASMRSSSKLGRRGDRHRLGFAAMATRDAACHCGQLRLEVAGDPFAVSICTCLACQRRTGSAFGMQAGFKADQVHVVGRFSDFARISDEADRKEHVFHFCPDCGSQVFYTEPTEPDLIVASVGSFADPSFPPPTESGYDSPRHRWVGRSTCGRAVATWRRRTPTSIRSGTSPLSRNWSAARASSQVPFAHSRAPEFGPAGAAR